MRVISQAWILSAAALACSGGCDTSSVDSFPKVEKEAKSAASASSHSPVDPSYSLEFKLSVIDDRPGDALAMNRFRSLLAQLDASYVETPMQIADMTAKIQDTLRNDGISVSLLEMMEGMNTIFPMPMPNQEYVQFLAMYGAARQKGYSHERAITTLTDFVYGLLQSGASQSNSSDDSETVFSENSPPELKPLPPKRNNEAYEIESLRMEAGDDVGDAREFKWVLRIKNNRNRELVGRGTILFLNVNAFAVHSHKIDRILILQR
jgi:hypothetical protein